MNVVRSTNIERSTIVELECTCDGSPPPPDAIVPGRHPTAPARHRARTQDAAAGAPGRQVPGSGVHGGAVPGALPGAGGGDAADHAADRWLTAHEPPEHEPRLGNGQCRVRGWHGSGRPVRPAPTATPDAAGLSPAAGDRIRAP